MVDQLEQEYAGTNVVFVDHDVDDDIAGRRERWWLGYGAGGSVYLPLVMVDSGHQVTNGTEDFHTVYSSMVDTARQRPAAARMTVSTAHDGNVLHFDVELTNTSGTVLSSTNNAALTALVFGGPGNGPDGRRVVASASLPIENLADGDTRTFTLEVTADDISWNDIRWVVIADFQPDGPDSPFDALQAAHGP